MIEKASNKPFMFIVMNTINNCKILLGIRIIGVFLLNKVVHVTALGTCSNARNFRTTSLIKPNESMQNEPLLNEVKKIIPPLTEDLHKGQAGRIGIVGGSEEYTGGPYFAAISALKVGADLSHIFCSKAASTAIKSYSPELIVHPLLDSSNPQEEIGKWLPRLHAIVIGPGLGRQPDILEVVKGVIADVRKKDIPLVVDADGLFLVTQEPSTVCGYKKAILTPNKMEFDRLFKVMNGTEVKPDRDDIDTVINETITLSKLMEGVTIVRKGKIDVIAQNERVLKVSETGSRRRCGGQGDLLAGSLAVFANWAHASKVRSSHPPGVLSGYAACVLTRKCANLAFAKHGRSTMTTDMIEEIHDVFDNFFENCSGD